MATTQAPKVSCNKCKQSYDDINILSCYHRLCESCLKVSTKENVVKCPVPVCKSRFDATVIKEASKNKRIEFTPTEVLTIEKVNMIHEEMNEQDVHLNVQINTIKEELKNLEEETKRGQQDLQKNLEMRIKQLKNHYVKLDDELLEMSAKRKEQLEDMYGIILQLTEELRKQREFLDSMLEKERGKRLEEHFIEFVKNKGETKEDITVKIPGFRVAIEITEELKIADQINITAPAPKIERVNKAFQDMYKSLTPLTESTLKYKQEVKLKSEPESLKLIQGQLYVCMGDSGLRVYSLDLDHVRDVGNSPSADGVTGLDDGSLVVATELGLYHLNENSESAVEIAAGYHTDVTSRGERVYAALCDIDLSPHCQIHVYEHSNGKWTRIATHHMSCESNHYITLAVTSEVLYAGCTGHNCVFVLDTDTGKVLETHGKHGNEKAGEVDRLYAAHTDATQQLLVCDRFNNRLQVLSRDGTWQVVLTDKRVKEPFRAVYTQGTLYVLSDTSKTLSAFTY